MNLNNIGSELKQLRIMARITQDNAADLLTVSKSTISKVENNRQDITAREYFRWKEMYQNVMKVASFQINGYGNTKALR